jgi:glycosyltransferase involved in cell wall biosynthesis
MSANATAEPLLAVVTPVPQGGDSLAAFLETVRAQRDRNWIHMVADNASTDDTRRIAESTFSSARAPSRIPGGISGAELWASLQVT